MANDPRLMELMFHLIALIKSRSKVLDVLKIAPYVAATFCLQKLCHIDSRAKIYL